MYRLLGLPLTLVPDSSLQFDDAFSHLLFYNLEIYPSISMNTIFGGIFHKLSTIIGNISRANKGAKYTRALL
jgi:hypothetical protein